MPRTGSAANNHTRALRNLRPGPALHRKSLQGIRMNQSRNHNGTGRYDQYDKQDKPKKGNLALSAQKGPKKNPQQVKITTPPKRLLATIATPSGVSCRTASPVPSSCDGSGSKWPGGIKIPGKNCPTRDGRLMMNHGVPKSRQRFCRGFASFRRISRRGRQAVSS